MRRIKNGYREDLLPIEWRWQKRRRIKGNGKSLRAKRVRSIRCPRI